MQPIVGIKLAEEIAICLLKDLVIGAKSAKLFFAFNENNPWHRIAQVAQPSKACGVTGFGAVAADVQADGFWMILLEGACYASLQPRQRLAVHRDADDALRCTRCAVIDGSVSGDGFT